MSDFRGDVLAGLAARPRAIPARYFYDDQGSAIFEEITRIPEYYPTRAEQALLDAHAGEMALACSGCAIVEYGSGASVKTRTLLRAVAPAAYVPIDISGDFLRATADALRADFPDMPVYPVEADFSDAIALPPEIADLPKLGFFPGSTIGNLVPADAVDLLRRMRVTLGEDSRLLIGMDRVKDVGTLVRAYDDAAGVTSRFNLNLLARINRELDGTIPLGAFAHEARWNDDLSRIEMHLRCEADVAFTVAGKDFAMAACETIHTENSHKYSARAGRLLLAAGGWTVVGEWAGDGAFALSLCEARPASTAP
ncbi:Histidine-specific methyltransferase SAM-dependent domain-containing protein [Sphingomonas antarctica]|uniref:L-histidine N(alpha)-methyltransferase n=1 Tax=Sphingomonas antarctica TaxID=2040274 RepID=UPI0039E7722E